MYVCSENWTQKKITSRIDVPEQLDLSSFRGDYDSDDDNDDDIFMIMIMMMISLL